MAVEMSSSPAAPSERELIQRALQLAREGGPEQAEGALRDVLRRYPDSLEARALFGALAFQLRRYDKAVAAYGVCAGARPDNGTFQFNLGIARESTGDLPGAIDALLAACRLEPQNWRFALFAGAPRRGGGRLFARRRRPSRGARRPEQSRAGSGDSAAISHRRSRHARTFHASARSLRRRLRAPRRGHNRYGDGPRTGSQRDLDADA
jgi:tetratricopeptide (TPR) repeat protein